jgi:predicted site-specific integrase-resolvase
MIINDLLLNKYYRGNQTLLAKDLGINRGTFRQYMNDEKGAFHFVRNINGKLELFTNQTNKISRKGGK